MNGGGAQLLRRIYGSDEFRAVTFDAQAGCWRLAAGKQQALSGVRRYLTERCWPSYSYTEAEQQQPTAPSKRVLTGIRGGHRPHTAMNAGKRRGTLVHEQLASIAHHGFEMTKRIYRAKRTRIHKFVRALHARFERLGWSLVASELPVYNERFGSSIDLVCVRRSSNQLIFIELKVGGDNYYTKPSGMLENELSSTRLDNSPLSQAFVQLAAYRALLMRCYACCGIADKHIDSFRVVYVGESGIAVHKLTSKIYARLRVALTSLLYSPRV